MVVFKKAETFGYAVLEALASGVIVLTPKAFSYPEFKSGEEDLLIFVNSPKEAEAFISTHRWSPDDVMRRYHNTCRVIERFKDSARRMLEEVISTQTSS
jgi:glycosyltransferase involved in cell wall biosynthesis